MKSKKTIILVTILTIFLGCKEGKNSDTFCTLEFVYGLNINLIDANTSETITDDVNVIIKDGDYEEVLTNTESDTHFFGAGERPGTYTITITSNNYKTFISEPVVVTGDVCHVTTVAKTFELTPSI
jgi:hypothetical protein